MKEGDFIYLMEESPCWYDSDGNKHEPFPKYTRFEITSIIGGSVVIYYEKEQDIGFACDINHIRRTFYLNERLVKLKQIKEKAT